MAKFWKDGLYLFGLVLQVLGYFWILGALLNAPWW
jgi:hypothetical protein